MKRTLSQAVDLYLETRRSFGFALVQVGVELRSFARYAERMGHTGPQIASLAVQWAQTPQQCDRSYWTMRLDIVRRFARFWLAYDPRTEVPPPGSLGPIYQRRAVHIYTPQEVAALLEAASELGRIHPLRGWTFCTLVGLLDCTGLRIGEALGLCDQDIDWSEAVLTVRQAKYGHTRLIPVLPSTLEALKHYRALRDKAIRPGLAPRLFVTFGGRPLGYFGVNAAFRKLCRGLGWTQPPVPRLHDFRHHSECRIIPSGA